MIVSTAALAATLKTTADKLHCPLPPGFSDALAAARALPPAVDQLAGHIPAMHQAALNCLSAGEDPSLDKDVVKYVIATALAGSGLRQSAEARTSDDIKTAIGEYADAIIEGWSDAIADDLAVLHSAANDLHLDDLNAADHTQLRRTNKLVLWSDAAAAADRADLTIRGYGAILTVLAVESGPAHRPLLLAPDITLQALSELSSRSTAWSIARTGTSLRLASIGDYTAAIGRLMAERQAAQRQAEVDREAAQRSSRGPMPPIPLRSARIG